MAARRKLPEELERYQVGAKVRRMRLRKKISLDDLGRHTRLSPTLLSKLERGLVMPTLTTLNRIALVFDVGLNEFFVTDAPGAVVVRAADRLRFPEIEGDESSAYDFESLDFVANGREMNSYLAEFRCGNGPLRIHAHDAAEFLYLVAGKLTVQVDDVDHQLGAGDSMYINPGRPHGYARSGDERCVAIVVTSAAPAAATFAAPPARRALS